MMGSVLPRQTRHQIAAILQDVMHISMYVKSEGRSSLRQLEAYRDRFAGKTCVVLGNGPSIKTLDLSSVTGFHTFCLNRGYLLWADKDQKPSFLVAVNDLVVEQFAEEIARLECPVFVPWRHRERFRGLSHAVFLQVRWNHSFATDATQGIWPGATVTVAALQLAYHMGFSKVILLGIDHQFHSTGRPHAEVRQQGDDPNHFHPNYFGDGTLWNLPDLQLSEKAYAMAKHVFQQDGRQIINATSGSALNVFDKMDLQDILESSMIHKPL